MGNWPYQANYLDGNDIEAVFRFIQATYPAKFSYQIYTSPPIDDFVTVIPFMVILISHRGDKTNTFKFTSVDFRSRDALLTYCFPYMDALLESWDNGEIISTESG